MPIIMKHGKLVNVPHLKSDIKKKVEVSEEEAVKPESITSPAGEEEESENSEMTVKELKAKLKELNVDFPKSAKKQDLIDLLDSESSSEEEDEPMEDI